MGCTDSREKTEDSYQPGNNSTVGDSFLHTQDCNQQQPKNYPKYVAVYDYDARTVDDLTVIKGDKLVLLNKSDADWWVARDEIYGREGYVPSNFLAIEDSIDLKEWYFDRITKKEVERKLTAPDLPRGCFLIRETRKGIYLLSIRDIKEEDPGRGIRHYRIRTKDDDDGGDGGFYITQKISFPTLDELVLHYQTSAEGGLACQLTTACPKGLKGTPNPKSLAKDTWEVPRTSLTFDEKLALGNYGDVLWKGTWNGKVPVAIKTMQTGSMSPSAFLAEAHIMRKLRHKNLVQLYAVCSDMEPIYIVSELMINGSLLDFLRELGGGGRGLKLLQQIDIAAQIACGMAYLEKENFIHQDLAARNILVGEELNVKIADFGLSRLLNEEIFSDKAGFKFPVKWTAPEAFLFGKFSIKSDVWSYGILMYEIITLGRQPYPEMRGAADILESIEKGYRMSRPATCPESLYDIMKICWHQDPQSRPTFEFLHSFMDEYSRRVFFLP